MRRSEAQQKVPNLYYMPMGHVPYCFSKSFSFHSKSSVNIITSSRELRKINVLSSYEESSVS
jgi:hypothetical protein